MLKSIKLHNFRTYLNTSVDFSARHLLIGRNNSGKTNLTRAMKFLSATSLSDLAQASAHVAGGSNEIPNWYLRNDVVQIACACDLVLAGASCHFEYELDLSIAPGIGGQAELRLAREQLRMTAPGFANTVLLANDGHQAVMLHEPNHLQGREPRTLSTIAPMTPIAPAGATMLSKLYEADSNQRAIAFRRYLSGWAYFALNPESMRYGSQQSVDSLALAPDGQNLAYVIYQLKNLDELRYRRVIDHVRILEPELVAINYVPTPGQPPVPFVALERQPRSSWVGLSDGTLRALALATIVELGAGVDSFVHRPTLSIIEEPENGIAPPYLRRLFDLFEERAPAGQFIFTSHSPYFIDMFDGERRAVSVLRRAADRTLVDTPTSHGEADFADDRLTLSEEYATELIG